MLRNRLVISLFIAILFGLVIRFAPSFGFPAFDSFTVLPFYKITMNIVVINIALALFNLVPIPPLDGSKILFSFLPRSAYSAVRFLEQYSLIILVIFIFFLSDFLYPLLIFLFHTFTGLYF